jgi:hypothetical protein
MNDEYSFGGSIIRLQRKLHVIIPHVWLSATRQLQLDAIKQSILPSDIAG